MAPKARMRQANKLNEAKVTKRGKIPTTLVSTKLVMKYFGIIQSQYIGRFFSESRIF